MSNRRLTTLNRVGPGANLYYQQFECFNRSSKMAGEIVTEREDKICTIKITNPDKKNALNIDMLESLQDICSCAQRDNIRCLVLTGHGQNAFSSGFDIAELESQPTAVVDRAFEETIHTLYGCEIPVIASINGDVFGGAFELAACCDLRIARVGARFGITPAKFGIVYPARAINLLLTQLGPVYTRELLFTANMYDATDIHEMGFLNYLTDVDNHEAVINELATSIASNAPLSITGMKHIIRILESKPAISTFEQEFFYDLKRRADNSKDHEEALNAYSEGREPEFSGE